MTKTVALCLLCLTFTAAAAAQTSATLTGVVVDVTGGALTAATVSARNTETNVVRETTTDASGRFVLGGLPVGEYEVRASLNGFRTLSRTGLRLSVGEQASLTLTLQVGAAEVVTVVGGTSPINTRTSELSYLVDERTIGQIPINGRNFTDLMSLQPMVNPFPHRDNGSVVAHGLAMSVNGQDPRANVYLLDGTLLNDFTNGPAGSAAGTALGMETVREFRVESNGYSAEFGRNVGGQINAITKSGSNRFAGSIFEYHRNDVLDARNHFDVGAKPDFRRNQYGGTLGGPIARDRMFFFIGYEGLKENLGRTVLTVVPDDDAREGRLPDGLVIPIDPGTAPYLAEFPRANGENLGGGLARHSFPFDQQLDQHFVQGRADYVLRNGANLFARYTFDDAEQRLPTDFPQFPRAFVSRNHFFTAEYRQALSATTHHTVRFGYSRTRIAQAVEANTAQPLPSFVPGRPTMGAIDIGGVPRFGPQLSADVRLRQSVISGQYDVMQARGRHYLKVGALVEHYQDTEFNPTFSLGVFRFAGIEQFLRNRPASFIGLTPEGDINREWKWTLIGLYAQDDWVVARDVTVNAGMRFETATMPEDPRDIRMPDLLGQPVAGTLYDNPGGTWSPRLGGVWNVLGSGKTAVRGSYGLYFNTNNHQNLIVTVTNPPATPRVVIQNPTFPVPPFERAGGISVRPIQTDVQYPRVHMWNLNVQHEFAPGWSVTVGYAGARGKHLWRNSDVNIPDPPAFLPDGSPFYPSVLPRPNASFSAIELKSSDGNSWYRALIVDLRKRWSGGLQLQSSYTRSISEDTTQNSTFFSDSTTATTSAMPEFIPDYNKGYSDFHAKHSWVMNAVWEIPSSGAGGVVGALINGWQVSAIVRMRSGNPVTPFVAANRSRSGWSPSLGPGTGPDRPSYAPGRGPGDAVTGDPNRWFDLSAFVLQPAGTYGNVGRNELIGPNLKTVDAAFTRVVPWRQLGAGARLELRVEVFNVFDRVNFGPPALVAFAGSADNEAPLSSFGQIRSTVTSARQVQLGARLVF